ncbi:hypothetical protein [Anaeromyxobacter soli]|uniref:hypothetical protein n=1 Tax=Anaeromyxobacter soli TaxID=2922725 RepID=UPI0038CBF858
MRNACSTGAQIATSTTVTTATIAAARASERQRSAPRASEAAAAANSQRASANTWKLTSPGYPPSAESPAAAPASNASPQDRRNKARCARPNVQGSQLAVTIHVVCCAFPTKNPEKA